MKAGSKESTFTEIDKAIREEYPDIFQDPKGLPTRHLYLGTGDFRIGLQPDSTPSYWSL
jgi:hypothetical protein